MRFTEFISEAGSPAQQAAIAIAMKKAGKKPMGVAEGAPELLKAEMPMVRHIENELATKGYKKGTEEYKKMFGHALAYYRKFGFPDYRKGVTEGEYQHKYGHEFKDFKAALEKKHGQGNVKIVGDGNVADAYHVETGKHLGFIDGSHAEVNEQGVAENNLDKYKKYTRPVVKTTPKIERTTNPSGRSTDHVEWIVTSDTGEKKRFTSKRLAQEYYNMCTKQGVAEGWSQKYKKSINCSHPKGFSQKAHCAGKKKHNESIDNVMEMTCPDCGMCQSHGDNSKDKLDELKCWSGFHRVAGTKAGFPGSCAKNKTNEEQVLENLHKWFKEKWVRFGPDGKIRGDCARGSESEGKPKCLPQSKAHSLGKKGRASAASRKRREDPNANRSGKAINVSTKGKGK